MTINDFAMLVLAFVGLCNTGLGVVTYLLARQVKHATNSIMDARLAETRIASEARGVLREREKNSAT